MAQFSARAEHLGVDLGVVPGDAPTVDGDAPQITILLNNLVDNALRSQQARLAAAWAWPS